MNNSSITTTTRNRRVVLSASIAVLLTFFAALYFSGRRADGVSSIDLQRGDANLVTGDAYGRLPLAFEVNNGRSDASVRFLARGNGYNLWLTDEGATLRLNNADDANVLQMRLGGARKAAEVTGASELAGKANYFLSSDKSQWKTDVDLYSQVKYAGVYDGVDLVYYGNQQQLEYDFVVAPGADPSAIKINFKGAENASVDTDGALVLHTSGGDVSWRKPVSYQDSDGVREEIASRYVVGEDGEIGFELGAYDPSKTLTIDPTLAYATYFSTGNSGVQTYSIKADSSGNAYVSGTILAGTGRDALPTTPGAYRLSADCSSCLAAFVAKFNPTGTALVYSTYLGEMGSGSRGDLAVDAAGNAYVTGMIQAFPNTPVNYPTTTGAYQPTHHGGRDVFVTKLNPSGNALVFSTFFGGSKEELVSSIALDAGNNVYILGQAYDYFFNLPFDFPTTPGTIDTTNHVNQAFVAKLSANGSSLLYSSLLFVSASLNGRGLAVDGPGNAYLFVEANADPNGLSTTPNAFQTTRPAVTTPAGDTQYDTMLVKLNPTATQVLYSSYLAGGGREFPGSIAVDSLGKAYLKGITGSVNFPTTAGAFQAVSNTTGTSFDNDGFVTVVDTNASGAASLVYSTYLGGRKIESENSSADFGQIAVDGAGRIWIAGTTNSDNFPVTSDALLRGETGNFDSHGFIAKVDPRLSGAASLVYSTYFSSGPISKARGIAVDAASNVYVTGLSEIGLPTRNGAYQSVPANFIEGSFLAKFAAARHAPVDFDNDGKTDISIFRPSDGSWWYSRSTDAQFRVFNFGTGTDSLAPGDWTGDGKTDIAVWRPSSGTWFIQRSEDNSFFSFPFGAAGDVPVPNDYDGDGKTDAAVFRASTGTWFISNSSGIGTTIVNFGGGGDKPVASDYDGDGKADIAIFRPSDGSWWYVRSTDGQFRVFRFGVGTDKAVPGDYTGDGKTDIAVWRPSTGEWFVQRSEDNSFFSFPFGGNGDVAVPGDFDGDGIWDAAVFRPSTATWYVNRTNLGILIANFGAASDRPVPGAFVP